MIEYKQNYPLLLEQNKQLKAESQKLVEEKAAFENQTEGML